MIKHGAEVELPYLGELLQASCPKSLVVAQDWQGLSEVAANVDVVDFRQKCFKASIFRQVGISQPRLGMQTFKGFHGAKNLNCIFVTQNVKNIYNQFITELCLDPPATTVLSRKGGRSGSFGLWLQRFDFRRRFF